MPYLSNEEFNEIKAVIGDTIENPALREHMIKEERDALYKAFNLMKKARDGVASPELRQAAEDEYGTDEIEIDDEGAGTAPGEGGIWVQAWVWVADDEEEEDEE